MRTTHKHTLWNKQTNLFSNKYIRFSNFIYFCVRIEVKEEFLLWEKRDVFVATFSDALMNPWLVSAVTLAMLVFFLNNILQTIIPIHILYKRECVSVCVLVYIHMTVSVCNINCTFIHRYTQMYDSMQEWKIFFTPTV